MKGFKELKRINKDSNNKEEIKSMAIKYHLNGDIDNASNWYQKFIDNGFIDPDVFSNFGVICQNSGQLEKSINLYNKSIKFFPNFKEAYSNLGGLYKAMGKSDDSKKLLLKAIEIDDKFSDAYLNLGLLFKEVGDLDNALKHLKIALDLEKNSYYINFCLGEVLYNQKNFEDAQEYFLKAFDLNPHNKEICIFLIEIYFNKGLVKKAESFIKLVVKLNSKNLDLLISIASYQINSKKYNFAEDLLKEIIVLDPSSFTAYCYLGMIYRGQDKISESKNMFLNSIKINPKYSEGFLNLGKLYKQTNEINESIKNFKKSIDIDPKSEAFLFLGSIYRDLDDLEQSKKFTLQSIELNPSNAEAYALIGHDEKSTGDIEKAESYFKKSIDVNKSFFKAYVMLFSLYEESNLIETLKDSLKEYSTVKEIKDLVLLYKSRLSFREKEYKKAKNYIDDISTNWIKEIEGKDINTYLIYWSYRGFIEDKLKNFEDAYSFFQKSQEHPFFIQENKNKYISYINQYKELAKRKDKFFKSNIEKLEVNLNNNLAFLVGFPRSGTTLLDTILRSHREIEVIEEKPLITDIENFISNELNKDIFDFVELDINEIKEIRKRYFSLTKKHIEGKSKLVIDKLPLHTVSIPLIVNIFPEAKIIFTCRNPYDTVLSCFQQFFKPNIAMANFSNIDDSARLYNLVMSSWKIYQKEFKFQYFCSKYEDLLEDFICQVNKILNFLELDWDDEIINYQSTAFKRGRINTPSSSQVIQPLYKSSIAKWKNYDKYFKNAKEYLDPWMDYFDYK